jgi:hypothetical protein
MDEHMKQGWMDIRMVGTGKRNWWELHLLGGIVVVTCMHCWPAGIYTQALMGMGIDEHAFWRRWMDDTKKHMVIEILG